MKRILVVIGFLFAMIAFIGCSEEPPSVKVKNERPTKANVQIKTVNNTINHNDVQPGTSSNYQDIPEGKVDVKAEIQNENVEPSGSFNASNDNNYTIIIQNGNPPTIKIDVTEK